MISFYNIKSKPYEILNNLIDEEIYIKYKDNEIMIASENDTVLAVCFYEVIDKKCRINHLYSFPDDYTIEDALIRCIISNMDNFGIHEIFTTIERDSSFYCKIGFNPLNVCESMVDLNQDEKQLFQLDTREFFEKSCCKKK